MDKRLFITSVGTSFCQNNELSKGWVSGTIKNLEELKDAIRANSHFFPNFTAPKDNDWDNIIININGNDINGMNHSAEIDSLLKKDICDGDKIILLCSMTVECLYAALAIRMFIKKRSNNIDVNVRVVEGLVEAKEINFEKVGLPSFLNKVYEYVKEGQKGNYKVVLNPTGGYKALFSAMTIVGLICGLEIIYLFEESEYLVTIPALPLQVNIPAWTQIETVVDLLKGKTDFRDNQIYKNAKDKIGALLIKKDEAQTLEASALVELFKEYANKERGKPELITRTENSPLLSYLKDEPRKIFLHLTEIGHLIWKGDRVPEMADHALRHHSDIFHLAERFLLPIFYYNAEFLSPNELFVLLCALYLHDCGHVIGAIKRKNGSFFRLLPTEIRDHHHVLSYLRLKYPNEKSYLGDLIYNHLCDTAQDDDNCAQRYQQAWDDYLHTVATIGLYHRKKMKLKENKSYEFFKCYDLDINDDTEFPPLTERLGLEKERLYVFGNEIELERAILLVSLLRIIDSLDEQVSRTGDVNDIRFHFAHISVLAEDQRRRAETLKSALNENAQNNINNITKLTNLLEGLKKQYRQDEEKGFQPNNNDVQAVTSQQFREKLEALIWTKENKVLSLEYVYAYVDCFFKDFQKGPYAEKAYIKGISIDSQKSGGIIKIQIDLDIENDPATLKVLNEFAQIKLNGKTLDMQKYQDREIYRQSMLESLKKEYMCTESYDDSRKPYVVKEALAAAGIELQYG